MTGQPAARAAAMPVGESSSTTQPDGGTPSRAAGLGQQIGDRPLQRAADQRLLVRLAPRSAEPLGDLTLDHEPERLGVHEQPVHVEQDSLQPFWAPQRARIAAGHALKYLASG